MLATGAILLVIIIAIVAPLLVIRGYDYACREVGSEPSIITNMYKILIEEETDDTVEVKDGMGKTAFLFNALKSDDIDGYLEFTGTVLGELTKEDLKSKKRQQFINKLKIAYNQNMI